MDREFLQIKVQFVEPHCSTELIKMKLEEIFIWHFLLINYIILQEKIIVLKL